MGDAGMAEALMGDDVFFDLIEKAGRERPTALASIAPIVRKTTTTRTMSVTLTTAHRGRLAVRSAGLVVGLWKALP